MATNILKNTMKAVFFLIFISVMISCDSQNKTETTGSTSITSEREEIPDTVVQFLITSAASDFRNHQPPTPIDFRNVKIGFIKSQEGERVFVLCGEFLSKENNEWVAFTTIKTSGYEQYLGKTQYCQDATLVLEGESLSNELKAKFLGE